AVLVNLRFATIALPVSASSSCTFRFLLEPTDTIEHTDRALGLMITTPPGGDLSFGPGLGSAVAIPESRTRRQGVIAASRGLKSMPESSRRRETPVASSPYRPAHEEPEVAVVREGWSSASK